ncbi:MAG: TlpA family protein disulfide reductase [Proteobacteria bacterium]|nr:TlpA family protein disulfide reductase [Pseudomonadota bacterium]MBU1584592.1 TlpA family protein disulfide reductase [Pseudomonadota bacterium]MBU2452949.1 TlpA family protein disulfide reductase [Pseudomonadota bacterium]MBU2628453.1 TlpA family protein disulfide reductase [Pseudomonadota bacterium]
MENHKSATVYGSVFALCLVAGLLFLVDNAWSKESVLDKKFKPLGIITLAGIAPPTGYGLVDMDKNQVVLSDFSGKIVVLTFWTTWCPDCVNEMPDIEKLHKKLGNNDVIILGVDLKESEKKVKKFITQHNLTFKILLDEKGEMGRAFGIRSIPTTFILNKKGGLIGKAMGARHWDSKKFVDLFEYLIKTDSKESDLRDIQ